MLIPMRVKSVISPTAIRVAHSLALRIIGITIGLLTNAVLARALGVAEYAQFAVGLTLMLIMTQVADFGTLQALTAEVRKAPEQTGRLASAGLAIRVTLSLVAAAVVIPLAAVFGGEANTLVLLIIACCAPLGASGVLVSLSNAQMRPEVGALLTTVQSALWLVAVAGIAWAGGSSALAFAWAFLAITFIQTCLTLIVYTRMARLKWPNWFMIRRVIATSWPVGLLGLMVTTYYRAGSIVLMAVVGAYESGLYSAANKIIDTAQVVPAIFVVPLLPYLIDLIKENNRALMHRAFVRTVRATFLLAVFSGLAIACASSVVIPLIYGFNFAKSQVVLEIMGLSFVGITLGYVGTTVCFAINKVRIQLVIVGLIALISLSIQIVMAHEYGTVGAAWTAAITEIVLCTVSLLLCARHIGIKTRASLFWKPLVFIVLLLSAYVLTRQHEVLNILIMISVFFVAAIVLRLAGREEMSIVLRRKNA